MPLSSVSHSPRKSSSPNRFHGPARSGKLNGFDILMVVAGLVLLAGVGFVGYRTQVLGEPVDKVLPFLAVRREKAPVPDAASPGTKTVDKNPGQKKKPAGDTPTEAPQEPNPDDTLFGRRIR